MLASLEAPLTYPDSYSLSTSVIGDDCPILNDEWDRLLASKKIFREKSPPRCYIAFETGGESVLLVQRKEEMKRRRE